MAQLNKSKPNKKSDLIGIFANRGSTNCKWIEEYRETGSKKWRCSYAKWYCKRYRAHVAKRRDTSGQWNYIGQQQGCTSSPKLFTEQCERRREKNVQRGRRLPRKFTHVVNCTCNIVRIKK